MKHKKLTIPIMTVGTRTSKFQRFQMLVICHRFGHSKTAEFSHLVERQVNSLQHNSDKKGQYDDGYVDLAIQHLRL